jgi:hypothetical protein
MSEASFHPPKHWAVEPREQILALEEKLAQMPQVECELDHIFSDGLYVRSMHIPAGTALTGKVHKRDHVNFLMKGTIRVLTDDGMKLLKAPQIIPSKKGIKRAGFALTDVTWTTVHATAATDVETAEAELVEEGRPHILELLKDGKKTGELK